MRLVITLVWPAHRLHSFDIPDWSISPSLSVIVATLLPRWSPTSTPRMFLMGSRLLIQRRTLLAHFVNLASHLLYGLAVPLRPCLFTVNLILEELQPGPPLPVEALDRGSVLPLLKLQILVILCSLPFSDRIFCNVHRPHACSISAARGWSAGEGCIAAPFCAHI